MAHQSPLHSDEFDASVSKQTIYYAVIHDTRNSANTPKAHVHHQNGSFLR